MLTEWEARDIRLEGSRVVVAGAHRGRATSLYLGAIIVASPLDGALGVGGSIPRRCYHEYVSVLFRASRSAHRVLSATLKGGGLYTDLPLNYVSSEGRRVYRILIPDSRSVSPRSVHGIIARCRQGLGRLVPGVERELEMMRPGDWSVKRWSIGLPCSRPSRGVAHAPGIFWAGDSMAQYPSMDGAVESGFGAAMQVREFLSARAP